MPRTGYKNIIVKEDVWEQAEDLATKDNSSVSAVTQKLIKASHKRRVKQ